MIRQMIVFEKINVWDSNIKSGVMRSNFETISTWSKINKILILFWKTPIRNESPCKNAWYNFSCTNFWFVSFYLAASEVISSIFRDDSTIAAGTDLTTAYDDDHSH